MLTETIRSWAKRRQTVRELAQLSSRQLEDIGAFDARNAEKLRPYIRGL